MSSFAERLWKTIFLTIVAISAAAPSVAQNRIVSRQEIGGWSLLLLQDRLSDETWPVLMLRGQDKEFESLGQKVTATLVVTCTASSDYKGPQAALWFSTKITSGKVMYRFDERRVYASLWEQNDLITSHQFFYGRVEETLEMGQIAAGFVSGLKTFNRLRMSPKFPWTPAPVLWEFDLRGKDTSQAIDALRCS
jgi:hypothetical protein